MANQNSYGDIKLVLGKGPYTGGQEIKGSIFIEIFGKMKKSLLQVIFEGNEKSSWIESGTDSGDINYGSSKSLAYIKTCVHTWDNSISPGSYTFYFSLILPETLPGSFRLKTLNAKGLIKYYIRAEMISSTKRTIIKREKIEIVMPTQGCNGPFEVKTLSSLRSCCIFDRGTCMLSISQPSDSYNPSEKIIILVNIDNSYSLLGTKTLSGKLRCIMLLKDLYGFSTCTGETLIKQKIPCQLPPKAFYDSKPFSITLDLPQKKDRLKTMHSYSGTVIDIYFYIKVKVQTKGFFLCSGNKPIVVYSVKIVPEPIFIMPNEEECDDLEGFHERVRLEDEDDMREERKENFNEEPFTENNEFGDKDQIFAMIPVNLESGQVQSERFEEFEEFINK